MPSYPWTHLAYGIDLGYAYERGGDDVFSANEKKLKAIGCEFEYHSLYQDGDSENNGMVVIVTASDKSPESSILTMDTLPVLDPSWAIILQHAAEILKVEYKPKWILCCSVG